MAMMGPARVTVLYAASEEEGESETVRHHIGTLTSAIEADGELQVSAQVSSGSASAAASAHGASADLVVIGRTGASGRQVIIGSTAERVLRNTASSVLIVGGKAFDDIQQVLCPIEVDRPATVPIVHAARIALAYDATCSFLALMPFGDEQPAQEHLVELQEVVHNALEPAIRSELKARYEVGYANEPSVAICEVAKEMDLVVMGSQNRTGLARIFLGSVSERVASAAPVPVLVARPLT
jgi:nucleotide-binding universal stress UspA family protein